MNYPLEQKLGFLVSDIIDDTQNINITIKYENSISEESICNSSVIDGVYIVVEDGTALLADYYIENDRIHVQLDKLFLKESADSSGFNFCLQVDIRMQLVVYHHNVFFSEEMDGMQFDINNENYYLHNIDNRQIHFTKEKCNPKNMYVLNSISDDETCIFFEIKNFYKDSPDNTYVMKAKARIKDRTKSDYVKLGTEEVRFENNTAIFKVEKKKFAKLSKNHGDDVKWSIYLDTATRKGMTIKFKSNNIKFPCGEKLIHIYRNNRNEVGISVLDAFYIRLDHITDESGKVKFNGQIVNYNIQNDINSIILRSKDTKQEFIYPLTIQENNENQYFFNAELDFEKINKEFSYGTYEVIFANYDGKVEKNVVLNIFYPQSGKEFLPHRSILTAGEKLISIAYFYNLSNYFYFSIQPAKINGQVTNISKTDNGVIIEGKIENIFMTDEVDAFVFDDFESSFELPVETKMAENYIEYKTILPFSMVYDIGLRAYTCFLKTKKGLLPILDRDYFDSKLCNGSCDIRIPVKGEQYIVRHFIFGFYAGMLGLLCSKFLEIKASEITMTDDKFHITIQPPFDIPNSSKILLWEVERGEEHFLNLNFAGDSINLTMSLNELKKMDSGLWAIYIEFYDGDNLIRTNLGRMNDLSVYSNKRPIYKFSLNDKNISLLLKNNKFILEIKEIAVYEKASEKKSIKKAIKKAHSQKTIAKHKKPIWLIGENLGMVAQDNGFAFFKYCIDNNIDEEVYYVAKAENKHMDNLKPYMNHVVLYDSFEHKVLYEMCEFLIVSHGIRDVMPSFYHDKMNKNEKDVIYLQHGIIAMKKLYFNANSYNGKIRKFVVSSTQEKQICDEDFLFDENVVCSTGLARFDYLKKNTGKKDVEKILIMPTWRDWILYSKENFKSSKFFLAYKELLESKELLDLLRKKNIRLIFYPHIEIVNKYLDIFKTFENDVIEIANPEKEDVNSVLKTSDILITDYSSVAFDFLMQDKCVIFYQFDEADYMKHRGAYISFERQLPGKVCYTKDEILKEVDNAINRNGTIDPIYVSRLSNFWDYDNSNNCSRIYSMIMDARNEIRSEQC